jgi:hypothetical protein
MRHHLEGIIDKRIVQGGRYLCLDSFYHFCTYLAILEKRIKGSARHIVFQNDTLYDQQWMTAVIFMIHKWYGIFVIPCKEMFNLSSGSYD